MIINRDRQKIEARMLAKIEALKVISQRLATVITPGLFDNRANIVCSASLALDYMAETEALDEPAMEAYREMKKQLFRGENPIFGRDEFNFKRKDREVNFYDIEKTRYAVQAAIEDLEMKQYGGLLGVCFASGTK